MGSGVTAPSLAVSCCLGVLAFHFTSYLTTRELRQSCSADAMPLL
jgi:hypothetical protein